MIFAASQNSLTDRLAIYVTIEWFSPFHTPRMVRVDMYYVALLLLYYLWHTSKLVFDVLEEARHREITVSRCRLGIRRTKSLVCLSFPL